MGVSVQDDMKSIVDSYFKSVHDMGQCFSKRFCKFWMNDERIYKQTATGKIEDEAVRNLHNLTSTVIRNRRDAYKNNNINDDKIEDNESSRKYAMLDLLLRNEKEGLIDDDGVREEVDSFMFAVNVDNIRYYR